MGGVIRGVPGALTSDPDFAARLPGAVGNRIRIPYATQWNPAGPFSIEFWARPAQNTALTCPAASVEFIATPTAQRNGWLIYQDIRGI
jgi:hypothetical protein